MLSLVPPWKRLAGALYALPALLLMVTYGGLSSLLIWPFAPWPRGYRERWSRYGMMWFAWMCLRPALFARIRTVGLDRLPRQQGYLVVSNHRSWVDVALLQLYTASNGVSKKEVAYIPFFGLNGYLTGAIFFDRTKKLGRGRVIEDAELLMSRGANVHVFPEGTRTRTGRLSEKTYLRLVQAASEAGFPLVPACVWGTEDAVPASGFYVMPGVELGIEIGEPVARQEGQSAEEHARAAWAAVAAIAARRGADVAFEERGLADRARASG